MAEQPNSFASSTGQALTGGAWLDVHFEANRPEFEAQVRAVGIQPGWHVLDAACGSGSFLPWLADLVGPTGSLAALDLAPDNVALVAQRVDGWKLPCAVEVRVGNVLALPYDDDAFDALWFANTSQYLTDAELATALAEFRRVVRPGGLVAVKESDAALLRVLPAPTGLVLRFVEACANAGSAQVAGSLRAPTLPSWLRRAGLVDVWRRSAPIEHTAPLGPAARTLWRDFWSYTAGIAASLDLPSADQEVWGRLRDPAELERYLDDPDFSSVEGNILVVGTVPAD